MSWFFIALLSPAFYSVTNFFDKYLISKHFADTGPKTLLMFSSLIGIIVAPVIFIIQPEVFAVPMSERIILGCSGLLFIAALFPYFKALEDDDASVVAPLFQLIPVLSYILAFVFLGETLTKLQILGSLIIILGALGLSVEWGEPGGKFKWMLFGLISLSSLLFAIDTLLFKVAAVSAEFWSSVFWQYIGFAVPGVIMLLIPSYKKSFLKVMREKHIPVIGLNVLNELVNLVAKVAFNFASLLAPVALVWVINGFQPLFIFVYGVLLTIFFPNIIKEDLRKKVVVPKLLFISIILVGTWILH